MLLRANTAVDVLIGPILDSVAATEEAGETIEDSDILLSKNGQPLTAKTDVTTAAFDDHGCYNCELDATDTGTLGILTIVIFMAGTMIYRADYDVISEYEYDRIHGYGILYGTVAAATSTTADLAHSLSDNQPNGWLLTILTSSGVPYQARFVEDFADANNRALVKTWDTTPTSASDLYIAIPIGTVSDANNNILADAWLDRASAIDGLTPRQNMAATCAAVAAKLSGADGTTITVRSADDNHDRIVLTVDADGNRSASTISTTGVSP